MVQETTRIFYVLNNRWPTTKAHGLQAAKTCEALASNGVSVTLVIPNRMPSHEARGKDPLEFYGIKKHFPVVRLWSPDWVAGGVVGKILFAFQQSLFAFNASLFLARKGGVIYSRDPFTVFISTFLRGRLYWEAHRFPDAVGSYGYQRLLDHVDAIVVITEGLKRLFVSRGVPPRKVAVIPDAVDPDEFAIRQTTAEARELLGLPNAASIIGYVGQLTTFGEEKGVSDLLRAFSMVHGDKPGSILLIVGGNERDIMKYRHVAQALGLAEDAVIFTGYRPHERMPLYMCAADVLVMSYPDTPHYAHYMSPLKLFEYLAAGKPIVTTDLPSIREIVGDEDVFFARPDDPNDLARAIEESLAPTPDADVRARRARERSLRYSWANRARQIREMSIEKKADLP